MRIRSTFAAALFLAAALPSGAWAQEAGKFGAPREITLALGDSLAFGYQAEKVLRNPFDLVQFHTGFAFVFAKRLAQTPPGARAQLVNYGCPGETTGSFLTGPCFYQAAGFPLHASYKGSQIDAAEALLAGQHGQVSPILISLGANDVLALLGLCPALDARCVGAFLPGILDRVGENLNQTLMRLRAVAPDAEIILLQVYNPLELGFPGSNVLAVSLNEVIGKVAAAHRARVANAFPPFNLGPQPATLCSLTLICTVFADIHASDAGYAVIADLMFRAAGYERFEH
jgi:lysophospholipase L1-like esterase